MGAKRRSKPLEIAGAEGHGPSPGDAVGRVGEPNEPLAALELEQLHDGREPPLAGSLRQRNLLDERGDAPGGVDRSRAGFRCHLEQRSAPDVTRLRRQRVESPSA